MVINLQDHGARLVVLADINDPQYPYYNPSIAYDGKGKIRVSIRSCNFTVKPDGVWHLADGSDHAISKMLYGYLDPKHLTISKLKELKYGDGAPFETKTVTGLEDARIFWRQDGMHFSGVEIDTRRFFMRPARQAEYVLDEATDTLQYIRTMNSPNPARPEKNWQPTDMPGKFDYSYSPTEVYKDDAVYLHGDLPYRGYIHGSSQLLWQEDTQTYLTVLHSKHLNPLAGVVYDRYKYLHYFAEYDANGVIQKISDAFTFGTGENIEFAAGMVAYGSDMIISLGIRDARLGLARISRAAMIAMLHEYDPKEPLPAGIYNNEDAKLMLQLKQRHDREQAVRMRR